MQVLSIYASRVFPHRRIHTGANLPDTMWWERSRCKAHLPDISTQPQLPKPVWGVGRQPDLVGAGTDEGSRRPQVMGLFLIRMLVPRVCSLSEN